MTEFPKKKFANHDTTDEMAMLGYGYNLAIDDYEKAIRDNLPSVEEIVNAMPTQGTIAVTRHNIAEAISKLYKERLNL